MSKDLIIALLSLAFAGCAGALLVALAKLDEWKERAADEHENHVAALRIGNANAEYAQRIEKELEKYKHRVNCSAQSVLWYADQLIICKKECKKLAAERDALQDFKSSTICPHSEHFWVDGKCKRCGRQEWKR